MQGWGWFEENNKSRFRFQSVFGWMPAILPIWHPDGME